MSAIVPICIKDLRDAIEKVSVASKPKMIGIDGPSGSGKSYFADKLSKMLDNSQVVPMDDFISWNSFDTGLMRAQTQLFEPLYKSEVARYQARDWVGDYFGEGLGEWKDVPVSDYIIFEGIGSCRLEFSKYLCVSIWVEAPEGLCIKRGLERDTGNIGMLERWKLCKIMEKAFFQEHQTKTRANYQVDGVSGKIIKSLKIKL